MNESRTLIDGIHNLLEDATLRQVFSGAACIVGLWGEPVAQVYVGTQATVGPDGSALPSEVLRPVTARTMFDLASVTKVFTAHTALTLVREGVLSLDESIGSSLGSFACGDKSTVTLRQLLSHCSGLSATWTGWRGRLETIFAAESDSVSQDPPGRGLTPLDGQREELIEDMLSVPLEAPPGQRFEYSCLGYNTIMALAESVTGQSWRELTRSRTLDSLGLTGVTVTADPDAECCAATEFQPELRRGVVCGVVHDETAWSLGGGAGNAGLFATAPGLLRFGEIIRTGADEITRRLMWDDALSEVIGRSRTPGGYRVSLGLRIGDPGFMGGKLNARGHTGFTGTSLLVERETGMTLVLLTNRVHPHREGAGIQALRRAIADLVGAVTAKM